MWKLQGLIIKNERVLFDMTDEENFKAICTDYKHLPNDVKEWIIEEAEKWFERAKTMVKKLENSNVGGP